jgi:hypothetical protein
MNPKELQALLESELLDENSAFLVLFKGIQRGINEGVLPVRPDLGVMEIALGAWSLVHGLAMLRVTFLQSFQTDFARIERETLRAFYEGLTVDVDRN